MTSRLHQVGISQRVRLEWLEEAANLVLAGTGSAAMGEALNVLLASKLSVRSKAVRGSRHKTVTILTKIWGNVPPDLVPLRDDALRMLPTLDDRHRHAIHWGMTLAVYPFWGLVAAHAGRLLRLQGTTAAAQVQRRVREQRGERQTVSRATARVLRSFVDWGALTDADERGIYALGTPRELTDGGVAAWLGEALLRSQRSAAGSTNLMRHPSLFPYRLPHVTASQLALHCGRLEALRQGLDEEVLMLRRS